MARKRQPAPQPPNGFIASATRLPARTRKEAGIAQGWQNMVWNLYNEVGELRYLANWTGNALSRANLHAAKREGSALVPQENGPAREAMDALYGGPQGQDQMLQLLGVDLTVSGEGYVTYREQGGDDSWNVLATGKVTQDQQGTIRVQYGENNKPVVKKPNDLVMRIWTPHPTDPLTADAPTRSNLKTLHQIVGYDNHISAQLTSRLTGAGLLFIPSEIQFAPPEDSPEDASQADVFMQVLGEAMSAAKQNPDGPEAMVPIVASIPGEYLQAVQHLKFWTDLDDKVVEMRLAAIRRFAIGMDVPPEVLLGNADANHWNAWLSEESTIKTHIEPRLSVINDALTTTYLRPALTGAVSDPEEYFVIADTSPLRVRPNKAEQAIELHQAGRISADAVLRETGFNDEDKMVGNEYNAWLLERIATGAVTPELTAEAIRLLGPSLRISEIEPGPAQEPPDHTRTDTVVNLPTNDPPERPDEDPALVAACEVLVWRVLERAGNKLKNLHGKTLDPDARTHDLYLAVSGDPDKLLDGAWDGWAHDMLCGFDVDIDHTLQTLDFYVRGLLSTKRKPSRNTLGVLLSATPALAGAE